MEKFECLGPVVGGMRDLLEGVVVQSTEVAVSLYSGRALIYGFMCHWGAQSSG